MMDEERIRYVLRQQADHITPPVGMWGQIEAQLGSQRQWRLFPVPQFRLRPLAMAVVVFALIVGMVVLYTPAALVAQIQSLLYFVPGIGIRDVDGSTLVAQGPVTVREGNLAFTVEALLSDGEATTVKYSLSGLPGGKKGWEAQFDTAAQRRTFLHDAQGHDYRLRSSGFGVGGGPEGNIVSGDMTFPPLPGDLVSVDLIVPLGLLVPPAVASEPEQFVLTIPLARPETSASTPAYSAGSSVTKNGVTLRAAGIARVGDDVVVKVEAVPVSKSHKVEGLSTPMKWKGPQAVLVDALGHEYKPEIPHGRLGDNLSPKPYDEDLRFPEAAGATQPLSVRVDMVLLRQEGSGSFTVPIKGRKVGDTFSIDSVIGVGDYKITLKSAEIIEDRSGTWLRIQVDLGQEKDGRLLVSFFSTESKQDGKTSASFSGFSDQTTGQEYMRGVPVDLTKNEIQITFKQPIVVVKGPWQLELPEAE